MQVILLLREAGPDWTPLPPPEHHEIGQVEDELGVRFPDDYREVLRCSNGGELRGDESGIVLEPLGRLSRHRNDDVIRSSLPGMVVFANDGGGSAYYYDPGDVLGYGEYHIFLVPFGALGYEHSVAVAPSLTDLVSRILAGDDLFDAPEVG